MGVDFNPNFPDQVGIERPSIGYSSPPVVNASRYTALHFEGRHTGPISYMSIMSHAGSSAPTLHPTTYKGQQCPMFIDLYPATGAPWVAPWSVQNVAYLPTAVTGQPNFVNENQSTPVNVNRIQAPDDGLYIIGNEFPSRGIWVQFDTAAFPLDRRILGVRVVVRVNTSWGLVRCDAQPFTQGNHIWGAGTSLPHTGTSLQTSWMHVGEVLIDQSAPATAEGWGWWTPQMIRDFRSGGPRAFKVEAFGPLWIFDYCYLQIFYTTETRIGVGLAPPADQWRFTHFPMKTPAATGSPSIVTGQDYVAVMRTPVEQNPFQPGRATMAWRMLYGAVQPDASKWGGLNNTLKPTDGNKANIPEYFALPTDIVPGILNAIISTGGPFITGSPNVYPPTDGPGTVVETSMPYVFSRGAHVYDQLGSDVGITQDITITGAALAMTYGQTSAMVGWRPSSPPLETDIITCEVWTATGAPEVRVFSPVSRQFADIERMIPEDQWANGEDNFTFRRVRFRHPESRTLPGGKYQIRINTDNLRAQFEFRVEAMVAYAHAPQDQTFGRDTNQGVGFINDAFSSLGPVSGTDGGGGVWSGDFEVTLMTVPPPVTGVALLEGVTTAHHAEICAGPESCQGCTDQGAPFIQLQWDMTSDALSVEYEIQRSDEFDTVFRTVAVAAGRDTLYWNDYEARIGVQSSYRLRSRRGDGIVGDWSTTESMRLEANQVALTFTSNAATGLACTYFEIWENDEVTREFVFQEYDDVSFRPIYNRERQVAFHPIERKGVTFDRSVLLNAVCSVTAPTTRTFNPLRIISWAPIPYVCVRDGEGNRWFAAVQVPTGTNVRPGERWYADVRITEVSAVPAAIRTDTAQVVVTNEVPL